MSIILVLFEATNGSQIMIWIDRSIHCDLILVVVPLFIMLFAVIFRSLSMPPTTKSKKTLSLSIKKVWKTKKLKATIATRQELREPEELVDWLNLSHDALNTSNEGFGLDFDPEESIRSDNSYMADKFCEEWLTQLSRLDRTLLGLIFLPTNIFAKCF